MTVLQSRSTRKRDAKHNSSGFHLAAFRMQDLQDKSAPKAPKYWTFSAVPNPDQEPDFCSLLGNHVKGDPSTKTEDSLKTPEGSPGSEIKRPLPWVPLKVPLTLRPRQFRRSRARCRRASPMCRPRHLFFCQSWVQSTQVWRVFSVLGIVIMV